MTANQHAYLIDPAKRTIEEVPFPGGAEAIRQLLDVERFAAARFDHGEGPGDVCYVDDEGLMKADPSFFILHGYYAPLAGRGLILGTGPGGESQPPRHTLAEIRRMVSFGEPLRLIDPRTGRERVTWVPARRRSVRRRAG